MAIASKAKKAIRPIHPSSWDRIRLKSILNGWKNKKILVIGDIGIDRYTLGKVERISPEAPVPIVFVEEESLKLGLAANVADNIHTLGGEPWLAGVLGRDRAADDLRELLRMGKMSVSHLVVDPRRRTVLKERIVSENQQLLRVDYESTQKILPEVEAKLLSKVRDLMKRCDAVILEDYAKGLLNPKLGKAIFDLARKSGKIVAVDPNARTPVAFYRGASLLTPNTKEAEALSGIKIEDEASLVKAGFALLKMTRGEHVVITRGKEGMAIFTAGEREVRQIPTYAREVYDVSGAGDTVISVLSLALATGATIEEAAVLGNLAAGVEVGKRGTATVSPNELLVAMEFFGAMASKA